MQDCLRWWDQHLKSIDTGIMDEPMLRAWIQDPALPAPMYGSRPGRWVAEDAWPSASVMQLRFGLAPGHLTTGAGAQNLMPLSSPATAGISSGAWCGYGSTPMLPLDQRQEEAGALVFDSAPLEAAVEILGFPELEVTLDCDTPTAILSATLSAIAANGAATRISYGILNLSHRADDFDLAPMTPGQPETIRLKLRCCGQRLNAGERIRLALATSHWPIVFPARQRPVVTIHCAGARLTLPQRAPQASDAALADFAPPETSAPLANSLFVPPKPFLRQVTTDLITGKVTTCLEEDSGLVRHESSGMCLSSWHQDSFSLHPDDPASAEGTSHWIKTFGRGDWQTRVDIRVTLRGLKDHWWIETHLTAHLGEEVVLDRAEAREVPRDLN